MGRSMARKRSSICAGPDLSATDLAEWLKPFRRPVVVINCASASSPFINKLSATGRVIVTATKSGYEQNYARFGQFLAAAIIDPNADLDKDGQTSLLEAFLMASRARHGVLRDRRSPGHRARLARRQRRQSGHAGGFLSGRSCREKISRGWQRWTDFARHQLHLVRSEQEQKMPPERRVRRDELEVAVARLRESKPQLGDEEYYRRLENLMLELAKLYSTPPGQP